MDSQKPIRTSTLKLLVSKGIGVARFRKMAERTKLNSEKDIDKIEKHINLWSSYGWLN